MNDCDVNKPYRFELLIFISMLYITCKISCNPMFFRQAEFVLPILHFIIKVNCSSLLAPAIYILSDLITYLTSRKVAIYIILFGILCDGLFSLLLNLATNLNIPLIYSTNQINILHAINQISDKIWLLYYSGLVAIIFAAIGEIILFSFIYKKINSFFISTAISIITTLLLHNLINEYAMLKGEVDAWYVIASNLALDTSIMFVYITLVSVIMKICKQLYLKR